MKKISVLLLIVFFLVSVLALGVACKTADAAEEYVLGFTCPNLNPGYQTVIQGINSVISDDPTIKLIISAPELETDIAKQLNMIEDLITKKVDAIALCTMADTVIETYIAKANEAGIPIILYNTPVVYKTGKFLTNIGFDQKEAGRKMARYALENYIKAGDKVGIIEGMPGIFTDARAGGVAEVLSEAGVNIVSRQPADWDRVKATRVAENMMTSYPDLKAIFAICDEMGIGAGSAVVAANKKDSVYVISHDGTDAGLLAIKEGLMDATVFIDEISWGIEIGHAFKNLIAGKDVLPNIMVKLEMVNKNNVAKYIDRAKFFAENYSE